MSRLRTSIQTAMFVWQRRYSSVIPSHHRDIRLSSVAGNLGNLHFVGGTRDIEMIQEMMNSSMVQAFMAWPYAPYAAAIAIFWLLCAIFSSIGAAQKGRSELGWFLVGLMFGWFGLLVYAMNDLRAPAPSRGRSARQAAPARRQVGDPAWVVLVGFFLFVGVIATSITIV